MQIHQLKRKTKLVKPAQVGRGGKRGKTSGRGTKGQKARSGHKIRPEIRDLIKKIPKLRGRGSNFLKSRKEKPAAVNLFQIEAAFDAGSKVTPKELIERGIVKTTGAKFPEVKILSTGELSKKVVVSGCLVSESARGKIEKAGGEVRK